MAKFTFADGTVFEGTAAEYAEFARVAELPPYMKRCEMPACNLRLPAEIEGPVRVGDTIEITDSVNFPTGSRYVVESVDGAGKPGFNDVRLYYSKYRIVARKEETPQPAKSLPVEGDYVVFDESCCDITAGKPYKVDIRDDYDFAVIDDEGDSNYFDEEDEYRIITDARELAFAKAGRKLDEFKARDIVRFTSSSGADPYPVGSIAEVEGIFDDDGFFTFGSRFSSSPKWAELIAPAESRVDGE